MRAARTSRKVIALATKLFGTDGIRGVANRELTPEIAFRLGQAVVRFLSDGPHARFLIGRDTRISGTMLESALIAGITSAGADAYSCGVIPTPAIAYLVRDLGCDGGVVISASHNPPEFNGLKVFSREGFKLPDDLEEEIEVFLNSHERIEAPVGGDVGVAYEVDDALERYVEHAVGTVDAPLFAGLKVAVDCGHGASGVSTPAAFSALGAQVTAINTTYTGNDINVGCGSTHLEPLKELMATGEFALGIAHDGDADRMLAVDEQGNEVDGDQIMAILAVALHERGELLEDTVVSTVMCNLGFEKALTARGIHVVKTKVGDRYVLEQMLSGGANLGGEQSGHVILLDHNTTGDGLVTALNLAQAVLTSGKPLSELKQVMTRYPQVLLNVPVANKQHLGASARIGDAIRAAEDRLGDEGRVLVRASGTEPLVRVMAEAADYATAEAVVAVLAEVVAEELS